MATYRQLLFLIQLMLSGFVIHSEAEFSSKQNSLNLKESHKNSKATNSPENNFQSRNIETQTWWKQLKECTGICSDIEQTQKCLLCIEEAIESSATLKKILDAFLLLIGAIVVRAQYLCFRNCRKNMNQARSQESTAQAITHKNKMQQQTSNITTTNNNYTYYVQNNYFYCASENGEAQQITSEQYAKLVDPNHNLNNNSFNNNNNLLIEEPK